jgi:hypothetical protein
VYPHTRRAALCNRRAISALALDETTDHGGDHIRSSLNTASRPRRIVVAALTALALVGGLTATADAMWKQNPDDCYLPPEVVAQSGPIPCDP